MKIYRSDHLFVGFGWDMEPKNTKMCPQRGLFSLTSVKIYVVGHKEKRICCERRWSLLVLLLTIFV